MTGPVREPQRTAVAGGTDYEAPCPDCGNDPADDTLHREGCRRIFEKDDPREKLQFGPPWLPWRDEVTP